ncbi:MAG: hypothetical protein ACK583_10340 [Cyanobacteriota bacterium]|jgi:hypothetical protein
MIRNVVDGGDLLDRLAAADRLHGNLGLELGAAGAALQKRAMGAVKESQTSSDVTIKPSPYLPEGSTSWRKGATS